MVMKNQNFLHLFLPFFLPLTSFSKLLSLWLITEDEVIRWFVGLGAMTGGEAGLGSCCWAAAYFLIASKKEKAGCWGDVEGGATGILGTPKKSFTPGLLITEENRHG